MGRDWLNILKLVWTAIFNATCDHNIFEQYLDLFKSKLGELKDITAKINVNENHIATFSKARPVPYSMEYKANLELERMVKQGAIKPIQYYDYASPIVNVLKPDGSVRLCADFKQTLNTFAPMDSYPVPDVYELYNKLTDRKIYTKLDFSQAYQQIDEDSKLLTTINTTNGPYIYNILPYDVNCALGVFKKSLNK